MSKQNPTPAEARERAEALTAEYRRFAATDRPDDLQGGREWHRQRDAIEAAARAARAAFYRLTAPLPLPASLGGPDLPFGQAVDNYVAAHGVSRAETFRRIANVTRNSTATLGQRYRNRGDSEWHAGWGGWGPEPTYRDPDALPPLHG